MKKALEEINELIATKIWGWTTARLYTPNRTEQRYGVESGSQRLLDIIHKGVKKENVVKVFDLTRKIGISSRGFFMLGLPSETSKESLETINFAKSLNSLWAQFTLTIPYPGTPMFNQLQAEGSGR